MTISFYMALTCVCTACSLWYTVDVLQSRYRNEYMASIDAHRDEMDIKINYVASISAHRRETDAKIDDLNVKISHIHAEISDLRLIINQGNAGETREDQIKEPANQGNAGETREDQIKEPANFVKNNQLYLVRCTACNRENWLMRVSV